MKLGCIGYGNMASAILGGILKEHLLSPNEIFVFDRCNEKLKIASENGISVLSSENDVAMKSDMILIAVKPKDFPVVLPLLEAVKGSDKTIISIAAGISISAIISVLGEDTSVVRAMPNTPLLLGKGTTALCRSNAATGIGYDFAKQIFSCAGTVYELEENLFDHVININGSSPAYIYLFAKTIAEFSEQQGGVPYETALAMLCDTLCGSAEMLKNSGKSADELIAAVSSPGGTTVAALQAFEANGFTESLRSGLAACVRRAEEIGRAK